MYLTKKGNLYLKLPEPNHLTKERKKKSTETPKVTVSEIG